MSFPEVALRNPPKMLSEMAFALDLSGDDLLLRCSFACQDDSKKSGLKGNAHLGIA